MHLPVLKYGVPNTVAQFDACKTSQVRKGQSSCSVDKPESVGF